MEELLTGFLGEIIIGLFNYPGAALRWVIFRGKKPYKSLLEDKGLNGIVFLLIGIVIWLTIHIFNDYY